MKPQFIQDAKQEFENFKIAELITNPEADILDAIDLVTIRNADYVMIYFSEESIDMYVNQRLIDIMKETHNGQKLMSRYEFSDHAYNAFVTIDDQETGVQDFKNMLELIERWMRL